MVSVSFFANGKTVFLFKMSQSHNYALRIVMTFLRFLRSSERARAMISRKNVIMKEGEIWKCVRDVEPRWAHL